jgi:phosphoribosylaminoimidazole carboxylase (NCAIR synthetase)
MWVTAFSFSFMEEAHAKEAKNAKRILGVLGYLGVLCVNSYFLQGELR